MSNGPQAPVDGRRLEGGRQQGEVLIRELARLAEQELPPADFYGALLRGIVDALAAPASVFWGRTAQGNLALQHHINFPQIGLHEDEERRRAHDHLLRQALQQGRAMYAPPQSSAGDGTAGNPTDFLILVMPVRLDDQVAGLLEVWQRPDCPPTAVAGFMHFLAAMSELASVYLRNQQRRHTVSREQLWTQLEAFTLQVQNSLNPIQVAFLVANEGRRLVECDRLTVAVRQGRRVAIEAISGVDVIEKRSRQVKQMRALCQSVLTWGDRLIFFGTPDDRLPPAVVEALDAYLEESPSKLLVVLPLRDPREKESKKPPRSALLMESFEPVLPPEQLLDRLEVVGKHATRSLYNAVEYRRIPLRWLWQPLAQVQDGLGGKARALAALITVGLLALVAALVLVPYPLKMEAKGQLLPEERCWIYPPVPAHIVQIAEGVRPGSQVAQGQSLMLMYDIDLETKLRQLQSDIEDAEGEVQALAGQLNAAKDEQSATLRISAEKREKEFILNTKREELQLLQQRTHADAANPGRFWLTSPLRGTVLNWDFRENLTGRYVKPSDPLLRIGDKSRGWEIELKIPQKHIGQVLKAFNARDPRAELDVDLLVMSAPTRIFKGKLARSKVAGEATPSRDDPNDAEPAVLASVRLDGPGIAVADQVPRDLLVAGTEVHAKIRCGRRAMGYALFYGVWEFLYDKVVFFF